MNRILFTNQKGGVGKTTLTREIGLSLGKEGFEVLFVDCDPQGNLSKSLIEENLQAGGLFEALDGDGLELRFVNEHVRLLSGGVKLSLLEKRLLGEVDAYSRLSELFEVEELRRFDFMLIDTPPSLGVLTINALAASEYLVIPMSPALYSMQGTNDLMMTVSKVRKSLNPDLELLGVIINAFDSVPVITRQIRTEIEEAFGEKVFETALSKSIRIEEAIARKKGIAEIDGKHKIVGEISSIAEELLVRIGKTL
ncbi:MAG: ParA family protein [Spirochaetales bacterium]|nr:ParA family protein [Spirochaetales bacterium]